MLVCSFSYSEKFKPFHFNREKYTRVENRKQMVGAQKKKKTPARLSVYHSKEYDEHKQEFKPKPFPKAEPYTVQSKHAQINMYQNKMEKNKEIINNLKKKQ